MSGYTFDENGKPVLYDTYTPGEKTLYHDKRGEGHNMGYDEYKVRKKLAIEATRRADNEDTIAKSKAEEVAFVKAENARIAYDKDYQEGLERAETGQASQALRDKYLEFLADTQVNTNKQEVAAEKLVPVNPYITDTSANASNTLNSGASQYQRDLQEGQARYKAMMAKEKEIELEADVVKTIEGNDTTLDPTVVSLPGMSNVVPEDLTVSDDDTEMGDDFWDKNWYEPLGELDYTKKGSANELATKHDFEEPFPGADKKTSIPKFEVGVGNVNKKKNPALVFPTFTPSGTNPQNSSVDTSGSFNFDSNAEDALSTLVGFVSHPAAQAFSTMKTLKAIGDFDYKEFYNKWIK